MRLESLDPAADYDSLYVAPSATLVAFSLAGRIETEASQGKRGLLVLCGGAARPGEEGQAERLLESKGVDLLPLPVGWREPKSPFSTQLQQVDELREAARIRLLELRAAGTPRDVMIPLGAGGSVAHQLLHAAALAAFGDETGRNLLLFEERPHVFVTGSLWVRLGQLGARLPPGTEVPDRRATLALHLARFNVTRHLRGDLGGLGGRLAATRLTARRWREALTWRPQHALGVRVQPIVQQSDPVRVLGELERLNLAIVRHHGSAQRLRKKTARYGRRIALGRDYAERTWLVLPERDGSQPDTPDPA